MKKISKILVLILASALIVAGVSGCGAIGPVLYEVSEAVAGLKDQKETSAPSEIPETSEVETQEEDVQETADAEETEQESETQTLENAEGSGMFPAYVHYDPTDFYDKCDELTALADKGDYDAVTDLYEELYSEALKIYDYYTIAELRSMEDASSESWKAEDEYSNDIQVNTTDKLCVSAKKVLESRIGDEFADYLDDDFLIDYYSNYDEITDELKQLLSDEQKLQNEYTSIMDNLDKISCTYKGKEYVFTDILEDESFYDSDPSGYLEIFENCYGQLNKQAGEVFLKLVKIRDEIAKQYGYDNYNDYADEELYGRDYSASDIEKMKTAVRKFGSDYTAYYYQLYQSLPEYSASSEQLVKDCRECITGISPLVDKAYTFFEDNDLYSIGNEKQRFNAGYTTSFCQDQIPFIFIKTSDSSNDLTTLTHEFGHFTNEYYNPAKYPLFVSGSFDLFEIHSTGLQLLAGDKYEKVLGEDAYLLNAFNVLDLLTYITDGCIYDEWQRAVYDNPDMTLDEMNALFKEISLEYGTSEFTGMEYSWVEVSHNFLSPLYYFSYASSAFVSLQIWIESRMDYSAAVSSWEDVLSAGGYDEGYMTVIKEAGLTTFDNTNEVFNVMNTAYSYAQRMMFGF